MSATDLWCPLYEPPPREEETTPRQRPVRPVVGYRTLLVILCGAL